jgi:hypothetical protein
VFIAFLALFSLDVTTLEANLKQIPVLEHDNCRTGFPDRSFVLGQLVQEEAKLNVCGRPFSSGLAHKEVG